MTESVDFLFGWCLWCAPGVDHVSNERLISQSQSIDSETLCLHFIESKLHILYNDHAQPIALTGGILHP